MASERQINSLPGLLAVKMIQQQISLTNRLSHQSITLINKRQQWWTRVKHCRLKSGPPLIRGLYIHMNSPVSITELILGLWVGFISSHLTVNKLYPVNPRAITGPLKMSLLLEAKSIPALIIKLRLILVMHTDDLGWNTTSNQQGQMIVQNFNSIISKQNAMTGQNLYCTADCIPVDRDVWGKLAY